MGTFKNCSDEESVSTMNKERRIQIHTQIIAHKIYWRFLPHNNETLQNSDSDARILMLGTRKNPFSSVWGLKQGECY